MPLKLPDRLVNLEMGGHEREGVVVGCIIPAVTISVSMAQKGEKIAHTQRDQERADRAHVYLFHSYDSPRQ